MSHKKNHVVHITWLVSLVLLVRQFTKRIWQDRVSVYAAQASFFTIISSVPLVSLLANIVKLIWPTAAERENVIAFFEGTVPESLLDTAVRVFDDMMSPSAMSVLSISAVFIWWSAAKGVGAIREGVQTVYEAPRVRGYLRKMCSSVAYTLVFVVLILSVIGLLLFGEFLFTLLRTHLPHLQVVLDRLLYFKAPIFLVVLSLVFTILYTAVSRRSAVVSHHFKDHVLGAVLAAVGWLVFSWAYSFYMTHASRPARLYGNLTAMCLIMLWLYACMIILLCGAEVNKMLCSRKEKSYTAGRNI